MAQPPAYEMSNFSNVLDPNETKADYNTTPLEPHIYMDSPNEIGKLHLWPVRVKFI